jgi:hypothetical protein
MRSAEERGEYMPEVKSPQDLLDAANIQNYDLRAESLPRQFPYRFSFHFADDRHEFQMTSEDVSNADDLVRAFRVLFEQKVARVVQCRTNSSDDRGPDH